MGLRRWEGRSVFLDLFFLDGVDNSSYLDCAAIFFAVGTVAVMIINKVFHDAFFVKAVSALKRDNAFRQVIQAD